VPQRRRFAGLLVVGSALAALLVSPASAGRPMLVGFQDDPGFRWRADRSAMLVRAAKAHATIVRATANWFQIAIARPAHPASAFDPAYHFEDIDELVRNAQLNGMTVMLTIWGTPGWANGGLGPSHAPRRMRDLEDFAHAVADRYSGRYPGYPFVGHYTVWNEPNSSTFLAPTFDSTGFPVAPRIYARMCRAAYAGIKSASPAAEVAIGQTSSRGHGVLARGTSLAPGLFAELLARADANLPFDAWAHHPYSDVGRGPDERYRFPNVNLRTLHTFEEKLDRWFRRRNIPIWISEFACETRPGRKGGATPAQQAAYARQALEIAAADPRVEMFIWFTFRDDPAMATWDSGLIGDDNRSKPAYRAFATAALALDGRNPVVSVPAGTAYPWIRIPVWELAIRDGAGATIGATVSVYSGRRLVGVATPAARIEPDGYAAFRLPIASVGPETSYSVYVSGINDIHGNRISRRAMVLGMRRYPHVA
jgi:hypothetical protein